MVEWGFTMGENPQHLALLHARLKAEGLVVGFGDTTTLGGMADHKYLLTIFSADYEDGLWLMADGGLTPVIYRPYHTSAVGHIDPHDVEASVVTILKLMPQ